jgi:uroporphyrinogen-III synthase
MQHSVFISRNNDEVVALQELCKRFQWDLHAHSLIKFKSTSFNVPSGWEVIFFPSPRAVSFYFENKNSVYLSGKTIACAGGETANKIKNYTNQPIDFVAEKAGDTENVRSDFQKWLRQKNVLYVGSNLAQKNVLLNLPQEQGQFIQVYETNFLSKRIPPCTIFIFSSPSNVDSFFMENNLPVGSHVIAWGTTTANRLEKRGINVNYTLNSSHETEIIQYLSALNQ